MTFADLVRCLADAGAYVEARGSGACWLDVDSTPVELVRVTAGRDEWVVMSAWIGTAPPARHDGMCALVRCQDGWALRLVLPLGPLSDSQVLDALARLVFEAAAVRPSVPAETAAVFDIWT